MLIHIIEGSVKFDAWIPMSLEEEMFFEECKSTSCNILSMKRLRFKFDTFIHEVDSNLLNELKYIDSVGEDELKKFKKVHGNTFDSVYSLYTSVKNFKEEN